MSSLSLRSRTVSIIAGLISTVLLASCTLTGSVSPTIEKVKIGYLPIVQSLPLYVALEKGYFADEGIEVESIRFEAPNQIIDALLSNQIDIGAPGTAAGITAISQAKKPGTLSIFSVAGVEKPTMGLRDHAFLVPKTTAIQSVEDMRGKKLGILPGIQWRTITRHIFSVHGMDVDQDVTLVELAVSLQAQALASGQVDALLALEPVPTIVVSKDIGRILIDSPTLTDVAEPFYNGAGVMNKSFQAEHPKEARKLLSAFAKATQDIQDDPDAARSFLKGYTALDDELVQKVPLQTWKMSSDMTLQDKESLQKFFDIFLQHAVIDARVDASQLLIVTTGDGE